MKIYTEVIIDMRTGSTVSEESFDYKGEIAECRSYQYRNSKTTNFADGSYTIMRDKFTKAGFLAGWNRAGYEVKHFDKNGDLQDTKYFGQTTSTGFRGSTSEYKTEAAEYIESMKAQAGVRKDEEIDIETEEYKEEFKEAVGSAKEELERAGEAEKAETIRIAGRSTGAQLNTLKDALLASGKDISEVDELITTGQEHIARNLTDSLKQGQILTKKIVADMNTQEIGGITTAEQFASQNKSLADQLQISREQIANAYDIAQLNKEAYIEANKTSPWDMFASGLSGVGALMTGGSLLGSAAQEAGGWLNLFTGKQG